MEIWKNIEYDSLEFEYEVSNLGNVRSLNYYGSGKTHNLKVRYSPTGARHVLLAGRKVRSIAQLVLNAFVEPRPSEKHFTHHIDGDLQNDAAENLEWRHMSVQNALNGRNGFRYPKGHSYYGIGNRFKTQNEADASKVSNEQDN
jgi:NUMOD4 motif